VNYAHPPPSTPLQLVEHI